MRINIFLEREEFVAPVIAAGRLLAPLGVEVVTGLDTDADFQIVGSSHFWALEAAKDIRLRGPLGIWERADQETVSLQGRSLLIRDDCLLWFKDNLIRDPALNNAPLVQGYYHYNFLRRESYHPPPTIPDTLLSETELAKIHCINSLPSYDLLANWRDMSPLPAEARRIDVSFIGTVSYRDELLREHRLAAVRQITRLTRRRTLIGMDGPLETDAFFDTISRSKIVVSPWSMTMCSFKDWQALFAGCVLIKPDSWLEKNYHPDVFANRDNTVACRPDFSDLQDRVEEILDNYPLYYERALAARRELLTCRDRGPIARDLYTAVITALGRQPDARLEDVLANASAEVRWIPNHSVPGEFVTGPTYYQAPFRRLSDTVRWDNSRFAISRSIGELPWTLGCASVSAPTPYPPPLGNLTAIKLVEDRTPGQTHHIRRRFPGAAERCEFAFSFYAYASERSAVWVRFGDFEYANRVETRFDLHRGCVDAISADGHGIVPLNVGMVPVSDGWWWCWVSAGFPPFDTTKSLSEDSDGAMGVLISLARQDGAINYDGDGLSGIWIAGPRVDKGTVPVFDSLQAL